MVDMQFRNIFTSMLKWLVD